jgi:hypothetical protein
MKVDATIYLTFDVDDRDPDVQAQMLLDRIIADVEGIHCAYDVHAHRGDIEEHEE